MKKLTKKKSIYCGDCDEFKEDSDKKGKGKCISGGFVVYSSNNDVSDCPKRIGEVTCLKVKVRIEVEVVKRRAENDEAIRYVERTIYGLGAPAGPERVVGDIASSVGDQVKLAARSLHRETKFIKDPEELCPFCGNYFDEETGRFCVSCGEEK